MCVRACANPLLRCVGPVLAADKGDNVIYFNINKYHDLQRGSQLEC